MEIKTNKLKLKDVIKSNSTDFIFFWVPNMKKVGVKPPRRAFFMGK